MVGLFMVFVVATPAAAIVLTYLIFFEDGAKSTGRWGGRRETVAVGASPYRAGESTKEHAQGAPLLLRFVCWLCAMSGVVTTAVLAPAGLILMLVLMEGGTGLACIPVLLVSVSGFPAGVLLVRVARRVTRFEGVEPNTFYYLYVHHACVVGTMLLVDASRGDFDLTATSTVICLAVTASLGLVHSASKVPPEGNPVSSPITPLTPLTPPPATTSGPLLPH